MKISKKYYECVCIKTIAYRRNKAIKVSWYSEFYSNPLKCSGTHSMTLDEILYELEINSKLV